MSYYPGLRDLIVTPSIPHAGGAIRPYWYWALVTAAIVAAAYMVLVMRIDNTNVGTANGLWKSVDVVAWKHGSGNVDSGEVLYARAMGILTQLVPDALLRYGTPPPDLTFREMAMLNALFGGIASGLIFLLGLRFTGSPWAACAIAATHAVAGYMILNSINSEDIMPAYAFFLAATVCLFEYLRSGSVLLYVGSTFFFALATLLHWTVMVPGLVSFGAVFVFLLAKRPKFFWAGLGWLALFRACLITIVRLALPGRVIPLLDILYPPKADAGGWVGASTSKLPCLLMGVGNYFSGAQQASTCGVRVQGTTVVSWLVLALGLVVCCVFLLRSEVLERKLLALSALPLFVVGEAGALYGQPQDPQMQIQPMLVVVYGLMLVIAAIGKRRRWRLIATLITVSAVNGAWNVHLSASDAGADSKALAEIQELDRLFPKDKTMIVCHGFENWVAWRFVMLGPRDYLQFIDKNLLLTVPFTRKGRLTASEAFAEASKQIDTGFAGGLRVVAGPVWNQPIEYLIPIFAPLTNAATTSSYLTQLKDRYRTGRKWDTLLGTFVELLPPE